jgi:serpin B
MTTAPEGFPVAMGRARLLAPAADGGALAGSEINDFGLDLLRRLDATGNLCASPASIALALAMVRPGARGTTATEMDKVLHSFGSAAQASEVVALMAALRNDNAYDDDAWYSAHPDATPDHSKMTPVDVLNVSNAVFSQKGMNLEEAYLDALSSGFGAGVGIVDYQNDTEAARLSIDKWASDATRKRVPEILKPGDVTSATRIALANAIYLKAGWVDRFDPTLTRSLPFTRADGSKVSVPTMATELEFQYTAGKGYRAVAIPFENWLSMTIVVPDNMSSFVSGLTAAGLAKIDSSAATYLVDLTLPRFSTDSRTDLATVLKAMGMTTAFNPDSADLSGITTDQKLYLDKVIHEANIDVTEDGVTASAVTVVGGLGGAGEPPPHVQFHINQPFLYFLRDNSTGTILFMGRIDDPSAKS